MAGNKLKAVSLLMMILIICTSCSNLSVQQEQEVKEFNEMSRIVREAYSSNKEIAEDIISDLSNFAIWNEYTDELSKLASTEHFLDLIRGKDSDTYNEFYIENGSSDFYIFQNPLTVTANYFTSVSSAVTLQVIDILGYEGAHIYLKVYWEDGKINEIERYLKRQEI